MFTQLTFILNVRTFAPIFMWIAPCNAETIKSIDTKIYYYFFFNQTLNCI